MCPALSDCQNTLLILPEVLIVIEPFDPVDNSILVPAIRYGEPSVRVVKEPEKPAVEARVPLTSTRPVSTLNTSCLSTSASEDPSPITNNEKSLFLLLYCPRTD